MLPASARASLLFCRGSDMAIETSALQQANANNIFGGSGGGNQQLFCIAGV
jgi:hypothetical protein